MRNPTLFIDGSVNAQSKIGFGAYLAIGELESVGDLKSKVRVKRFEKTSSTKLELQTLLWALECLNPIDGQVCVHTDSQNLAQLQERRVRLEKNDFRTKNGSQVRNYQLYQEFYAWMDRLDCQILKVQGHQAKSQKDAIDQIFSLVDRAARKALRSST